jgi:predicted porin
MDNAGDTDVDLEGRSAYIKAKYNFGPGNVGAMFMYAQGDDPASDDEEGQLGIGADISPCIILFGEKLNKWAGYVGGAYAEKKGAYANDENVWLYQVFADYKVMPKLKLAASITYAKADEKPSAAYVDDVYGTEYDITATYSIYKNLSYKVGFGYLKAGDYFKGTSDANEIDDNYVVLNKLSLKF